MNDCFAAANSTARQRCEAFVQTEEAPCRLTDNRPNNREFGKKKEAIMLTIVHEALSITADAGSYPTAGDILRDANLQAVLHFGPSSEAVVDGVSLADGDPIEDGDRVVVRAKANTKG